MPTGRVRLQQHQLDQVGDARNQRQEILGKEYLLGQIRDANVDEFQVEKVLRHYSTNALEDDPTGDDEEIEDNDEDEDYDDEEPPDNDEVEEEGDKKGTKKRKFSSKLWPTAGVRQRWLKCLNNASTVGEGRCYYYYD